MVDLFLKKRKPFGVALCRCTPSRRQVSSIVYFFQCLFFEVMDDLPILFQSGSHEIPEFYEFVGCFLMQFCGLPEFSEGLLSGDVESQ